MKKLLLVVLTLVLAGMVVASFNDVHPFSDWKANIESLINGYTSGASGIKSPSGMYTGEAPLFGTASLNFESGGRLVLTLAGNIAVCKYSLDSDNLIRIERKESGVVDYAQYFPDTNTINWQNITFTLVRTNPPITIRTSVIPRTTIQPTTSKVPTSGSIASAVSIYASTVGAGGNAGYSIVVELKPGSLAKVDTGYLVKLYMNGQYRAESSVVWKLPDYASGLPAYVNFTSTKAEYEQYRDQLDLSSIFTVVISP